MASSMDKLAKELKKQITASDERKPKPYDTQAEVLRVENGVAWVHIPGGVDETPVRLTINAKKGDNVNLHVANGTAWITGNSTNPPTDDSTANYAVNISNEVKKDVTVLNTVVAENIEATNARFTNVEADTAKIHDLTADNLHATVGYIEDLTAEEITAQDLTAATGFIGDLTTGNVTAQNVIADHATVGSLDTNYAHITNGVIDNAKISYADVNNLRTNYAQINLANVNNAWIENGVVKEAAISDAQIIGVSANKLTAGTIDASNITVTNLNASNITAGSITVDGITIDVENNEASIDGAYIEDGTITLNGFAQEVKDVIDGAIETFTGTVVPTLNNAPANAWTTTKLKDQHIGDVYYVVNASSQQNGYCYRFSKSGSTYSWQLIKDSDVTAALSRLTTAEGKIGDIETFDEEIATFKTETEGEISTLQTKTTSLETSLGDKVDKSTFNEVKQTVDGNSASITELSTITTNNGLTKTTNITNTVNTVSQTATGNSSKISSLTNTLGTNADGTTKAGDIVHQVSQIDQDLDGVTTRVSKTEVKLAGQYATSSTGAGTTAKVATITPAVTGWTLYTGATVTVKFSTANTATTPTLNVNSTGAKTIKGYKGAALTEKEYKWAANDAITFIYDGTNWLMQSSSTEATRLSTAEASISTNAGNIALKANASDVYTKTAANALLEVKANKDTLTSEINASADTVKINANRVQIDGTATFNAIKSSVESTAKTAVDGIKVGGRNLLTGTAEQKSLTTKSNQNWFAPKIYILSAYANTAIADTNNTKITISFDYSITGVNTAFNMTASLRTSTASGGTTYGAGVNVAEIPVGDSSGHAVGTRNITSDMRNNAPGAGIMISGSGNANANAVVTISNVKLEFGNKATDWTPAPEDVQAEIDAKKSVHTLDTAYSYTYANILTYSAEGYGGTSGANWTVSSTSGVKVGDTVRLKVTVSDMSNAPVYVVGTVTAVTSGTVLKMTSHGLDTTIIDGGNILTNSIGADKIKVNEIEIKAAQIKSGTIDTARIPNLSAGKITSGTLDASKVTVANLSAESIKSGDIAAARMKVNSISAINSLTTGKIDAARINVGQITVGSLSDGSSYSTTSQMKKAIGNAVDAVEVGGRNLILFTGSHKGYINTNAPSWDGTSLVGAWHADGYVTRTRTAGNVNMYAFSRYISDNGKLPAGAYTLSATIRSTAPSVTLQVYRYTNSPVSITSKAVISSGGNGNKWTKYSCTFTTTEDYENVFCRVTWGGEAGTVDFKEWKLEKGNKATDWTPAPEDLAATATDYITQIDDNGIRIHPASTENDSVVINASGMEVFKGGTAAENSVAFYGDTARIGKESGSHLTLASDSMSMSDGNKNVFNLIQKTMYIFWTRNYKGRQFTNSTDRHIDSWDTNASASTWTSLEVNYKLNNTSKKKTITSISNGVLANDKIYIKFNYSGTIVTLTYGRGGSAASTDVIKLESATIRYITDEQLSEMITGSYPDTTLSGALRIGNGTSNSNKKNVMLVDWGGNAKFRGDVLAFCNPNSSGGMSLTKTEENLEICTQSDSKGTVTIDSYRVGRMVVLRIRMELAGTTAAGQRINTISLAGKHLPKPLGNVAMSASYYGTHAIGLALTYNSSASRYELAIHNASSTAFTPVSGYDLWGTLTYICEMDSFGNIEYVDD